MYLIIYLAQKLFVPLEQSVPMVTITFGSDCQKMLRNSKKTLKNTQKLAFLNFINFLIFLFHPKVICTIGTVSSNGDHYFWVILPKNSEKHWKTMKNTQKRQYVCFNKKYIYCLNLLTQELAPLEQPFLFFLGKCPIVSVSDTKPFFLDILLPYSILTVSMRQFQWPNVVITFYIFSSNYFYKKILLVFIQKIMLVMIYIFRW